MVPPGDPGALRDALERVLTDAELRETLVEGGRRRAAEFSMANLATRYIDLYERTIAATAPA
jgi:glycosyltransferase involved in cell wall biosynthesis